MRDKQKRRVEWKLAIIVADCNMFLHRNPLDKKEWLRFELTMLDYQCYAHTLRHARREFHFSDAT